MRVLAGDVGGTSARLAIFESGDRVPRVIHKRRFNSRDFDALTPLVLTFLAELDEPPTRACIGIAGPVSASRSTLTNLGWTIDAQSLASEIGIERTQVINDLVAAGHGLEQITAQHVVTLQQGDIAIAGERRAQALIGAGTGLGEAYVTWCDDACAVHASEGGHATFAASNAVEWDLARFLSAQFGAVSRERVISGPGLVNIYRYLCGFSDRAAHNPIAESLAADDGAAMITKHALEGTDPIAVQALDIFMSAYGAQAGNLALTVMATGGIYLTGGIAPRIVSKLGDGTFMQAFRDKGRLSDLLSRIPVHVIINPDIGLIGAALLASRS